MPNLLPLEDEDLGKQLAKSFQHRKMGVMVASKLEKLDKLPSGVKLTVASADGKTQVIEADGVALFVSRWIFQAKGAAERTFTATTVFRKQPDGGWKALIDNPFGPLILGPE